jgi:hypothetical protein
MRIRRLDSVFVATWVAVAPPSMAVAQPSPLGRAASPTPIVAVALTQQGTFAAPEAVLQAGLSIVDQQSADLDGDGDLDMLAFVDVSEGSSVYGPNAGRGAVVILCDGERAWRGRTIASVPAVPFESAYNWGEVLTNGARNGTGATIVRLLYSAAYRGRFAHAEYRLRFDRDGMHILHGPGAHSARTPRAMNRRRLARSTPLLRAR